MEILIVLLIISCICSAITKAGDKKTRAKCYNRWPTVAQNLHDRELMAEQIGGTARASYSRDFKKEWKRMEKGLNDEKTAKELDRLEAYYNSPEYLLKKISSRI